MNRLSRFLVLIANGARAKELTDGIWEFADATPATKDAIVKALADQKSKDPKAASPAMVAGLVLGSPDFQRR